jgi:hypothetical protein
MHCLTLRALRVLRGEKNPLYLRGLRYLSGKCELGHELPH